MRRIVLASIFIFSALVVGQNQNLPSLPPYSPSPSFPQDLDSWQMPPDTEAPPPQELSVSGIQYRIQYKLDSEPSLQKNGIRVTVDDTSVVLVGTVENERQHDLALRITRSYAGERRIVDSITIGGGRTSTIQP
jgi:hypothetical protein